MIKRVLQSYSALLPDAPGFLIPVFGIAGTNDVCVQDLDARGRVARFMPFDTDSFYPVPVLPPTRIVRQEDEGLLAFWLDTYTVLLGTIDTLRGELAAISEGALKEFAAVELTTFIGDERRIAASAARAAPLVSNPAARASFVDRALDRLNVVAEIQRQHDDSAKPDKSDFQDIVNYLTHEEHNAKWYDAWRHALLKGNHRDVLADLLGWRLATEGLGFYEAQALTAAIDWRMQPFSSEGYLEEWLRRRPLEHFSWVGVWELAFQRIRYNPFIQIEGERYLSSVLTGGAKQSPRQVLTMWHRMWNRFGSSALLFDTADKIIKEGLIDRAHIAESIAIPIYREQIHSPRVDAFVSEWLREPSAHNAWVSLFLMHASREGEYAQLEAGYRWLHELGRGSNQWINLWRFFEDKMPRPQWLDVAERWLMVARSDLSSWPKVFEATYAASIGRNLEPLTVAARRWVLERGAVKKNRLIEGVAEGGSPEVQASLFAQKPWHELWQSVAAGKALR